MKKILLIIPCYNEANRIQLDQFQKYFTSNLDFKLFYVFANDGSTDETSKVIEHYIQFNQLQEHWFLFQNPKNTGKANVIFNAFQWFQKNLKMKMDWIGYWDADLATPLYEVKNMLQFHEIFYPQHQVIFASRVLRLGSQIIRSPLRHYLGRLFATVIDQALHVGSYDSQCGAKLMTSTMADIAFREPFLSPWIFDIEIMIRVDEKNITEYALKEWKDIPGSKIKIGKEIFRVLKDIYRIKKFYSR